MRAGVYFPDVEDGPDSWPAFGGLLFSGSDLFGTLGTPVFSTTLWITASEPWSIAIQPLPILEGTTATGTGTTWIAVIEPIGEGTVVAPDGVFGVDVIGVDGYGDRLLYDGETRKRFTWSPSPIAVIGLRILDGIAWRLELGPADGSEG